MPRIPIYTHKNKEKMLRTINLALAPQYFENVFESIYNEWGENNPNYWRSWIRSSIREKGIPSTYVVLSDEQYVGTFSFWNCDLQSRQDLTPWVGGIVVAPEFRGQGIGLFIQTEVIRILKEEGIRQAFGFTELIGFYERTGWLFLDEIFDEKDSKVRLYKLCL